ncbi:ribonuclease P protein component [Candidatus Kaiserbacteria bacterium]|nr:ribonuclease P protein component [Candidatus Kaiserbacteria bacterium]
MLPKAQRLSRKDFLKRPLRAIAFPYGSVKIFFGDARAAVVISKKTAPKAVTRNALRRRIYSILQPLLVGVGTQHGFIVYPNKKALTAPFPELRDAIQKVLVR